VTPAAAWMAEHLGSAPPELRVVMLGSLPDDPELTVPDALAEAAMTLYARTIRGSGGREDALPLLAADALFTHAFEAQALLEPSAIRDFAVRWSGRGALGRLLAR
jgi:hypothetical protein